MTSVTRKAKGSQYPKITDQIVSPNHLFRSSRHRSYLHNKLQKGHPPSYLLLLLFNICAFIFNLSSNSNRSLYVVVSAKGWNGADGWGRCAGRSEVIDDDGRLRIGGRGIVERQVLDAQPDTRS